MIFIDTGAFYARYRESDADHRAALHGWQLLEKSNEPCCTTNFVIAEAATLLMHLMGRKTAAERIRGWMMSEELHIFRPGSEEEQQALDLLEKYHDQRIGFVDCLSFVTMRQNRINRVFGFDKHFRIAGFTLWPHIARN